MQRQRMYGAVGSSLLLAAVVGVGTLGTVRPAMAAPSREALEELDGGESIALGLANAAYYIEKAISEITVDGVLDEPAWASARRFTLDYETWPSENIPALVETEAWVTYGENALYVGFHAFDPNPAAIRARIADRDNAFEDDFLGISVDTFNDERRAFEFFVNPLGVQMDMFLDGVSGDESESWDAIWHSAGRITEDGYVVEMEIPFNQLRFPAGKQEHVWGFDLIRFYPRGDRHRLSIHTLDRDNDCYLCQASKMKGFGEISPGRNIEIVPTLTGRQDAERADFPAGELEGGDPQNELGLTARWGMTPNLTLSATVNPDFSQVEADAAQLAVNERFALFFPERRPFFLEGADFFSTPLDAVFTRNVAAPDWGLKLTGKQGRNAIGVFVAEDDITNLLLPGSEGSESTTLDFGSTDAVVRYRRDLGESSTLGFLMTHRGGENYANSIGGVDGLFRLTDSDSLRFQWLRSSTEYPGVVVDDFDQPGGVFEDQAYSMSYRRSTREWNLYSSYEDIGRDFRADLGFVPQVDHKEFEVGGQRIWYGEDDDWYNRIRAGVEWQTQEDQSGLLLEREVELNFSITGPNQLFAGVWPAQRTRVFNGQTFEQDVVNTYVEMSPSGDLYFSLFAGGGDAIDFEETRPAEVLFLEPRIRYNIGRHLKATLSHNLQQLDIDEGRLFEANLSQLRLVYQFNPRTFVRSISQYTVVDRNQDLFTEDVEARAETLFSQLLFAYKLNPQTVFFLGYSDSREGDDTLGLTQRDRAIFTKFGYAWVM